jgi:hypothetical protein
VAGSRPYQALCSAAKPAARDLITFDAAELRLRGHRTADITEAWMRLMIKAGGQRFNGVALAFHLTAVARNLKIS